MKKLTLILIGALIAPLTFSQDYYSFADSSAIWNEYSIHVEYPTNVASKTRYGTIGDTMINNIEYSKIYKLINDTCLNIENTEYFGAIREENKQIFALTIYHGDTEILLYDFSVEVGDTVYSNASFGYLASPAVISNIDSIVLLDGTTRKRYWINSSLDEFWIEGIGSQGGLFTPITDLLTNYYEPHLSCFKQYESTVYLNNYSCDKCFCSLETSIKVIGGLQNEIQIYPNPASTSIIIDFELNTESSITRLINSSGKLIESKLSNSFPIQMNIGYLPNGIYLIQIDTESTLFNKKFVKTE
jgi:hypothetical protein